MKVFSYIAPIAVVLFSAGWGLAVSGKFLLWDIAGIYPSAFDWVDAGIELGLIVFMAVSCWRWRP